MSSFANWRSTSYPAARGPTSRHLPSAIQRSEVWVGIATPTLTVPPFEAAAPLSEPEAPPAPPPAHPLSARAPAAQVAATVAIFPKNHVSSWNISCLLPRHRCRWASRLHTSVVRSDNFYDMRGMSPTPCPIDNSPITIVNVHILKNCHIHKRNAWKRMNISPYIPEVTKCDNPSTKRKPSCQTWRRCRAHQNRSLPDILNTEVRASHMLTKTPK